MEEQMIEGSPSNDDEAGRNRKPRSARTPAERLQAVQEKNRRAQKRFRERQKDKVKSMEEQLSDAYAEVARLKEENDKLTSRTSILEKVLALRDDQLQQASRGQIAPANSGMQLLPPPMPKASSLAVGAPPLRLGPNEVVPGAAFTLWQRPGGSAPLAATQPVMAPVSQPQPLHSPLTASLYTAITQQQAQQAQQHTQQLSMQQQQQLQQQRQHQQMQQLQEQQQHQAEPVPITAPTIEPDLAQDQQPPSAPPNDVGNKNKLESPEEVVLRWKGLVREMASLLVAADTGDPANTTVIDQQLISMAHSATEMCLRTAVSNPEAMHRLQARSLEPASTYTQEFADDKTWQNVLQALALVPAQVEQLSTLWGRHLENLNQTLLARAGITARLQQVAGAQNTGSDHDPAAAAAGIAPPSITAQRDKVMGELHMNMRVEHEASLNFVAAFFEEVLTPRQFAKAAVHSYPFFPNVNMIANLALVNT